MLAIQVEMDRRGGWPWKRKSSSEKTEKVLAESVGAAPASAGSQANQVGPLISVSGKSL